MPEALDEEALASHLAYAEKKVRGAFFTPAWLVARVLDAVAPLVPTGVPLRIVDPSCGAGAFLAAAAARWPHAELWGIELNGESAAVCRARVPRAAVREGNALLDDGLPPRDGVFELWVGNPPYNGTSPLLRSPQAWATACGWMPEGISLRKGTSLREDYVFFLLKASVRLHGGPGALAFVTSATLLDAWAHAPVRDALARRLVLREVIELERGAFKGTQVKPCVTVWSADVGSTPARADLKRVSDAAAALDARWRANGAAIDELVPIHYAGLKTRFDELLVDEDRDRLIERVQRFLAGEPVGLEGFDEKLAALRASGAGARFDVAHVRRFLHPRGQRAWCYVDRRLIPRGDHRFRGEFDPHASSLKLVFNARELPLHAQVLDEPGCVTMYRHTRFAPEFVPQAFLTKPRGQRFDAQALVPNLTPLAASLGDPRAVFTHIARHMESPAFQQVWAPAFGTGESPLIFLGDGLQT